MKASEWAIRNRNIVSALFTGAGAYHIFTGEKQKYMWSVRRLDFAWIWMKNREYSIAFHINPAFFSWKPGYIDQVTGGLRRDNGRRIAIRQAVDKTVTIC